MWRLNRDEQRVLLITFVGGVASIIVGACIIGIAIAIERGEKHLNASVKVPLIAVSAAGLLAAMAVSFLSNYQKPGWRRARTLRVVVWAYLVIFLLWLSAYLLGLIGQAAGIH